MPYKFKRGHKGGGFKGKFCTLCNSVWELIPSVGIVKHPDFPSFGLEREDCSKCGGASTEAKKPSTLVERAAIKHKKLGTRLGFKKSK